MDGILRLNDFDVKRNAALGSHDPSMMWDPVTRAYYSYSTDTYMPFCGLNDKIGIPVRSSKDLVHFRYEGTVLSEAAIAQGRDNGEYPPTRSFWAPYVEYVKGEYRMYYAATRAFGSSESRIWLAVAKHPLGPFENRGVVMDTWGTDDAAPNAIDAHIVWDGERCYLVYGSFFGGIFLKELNGETGLPVDGDVRSFGQCISKRNPRPVIDGPEGAAVIFVPETRYYYLFQSYGWLGDNYDIRVGRSRRLQGPYLDWKGRCLVEDSMGVRIAGSYRFRAEAPNAGNARKEWSFNGFRGPGHGVPFYDPRRNAYFFVHHIRDGANIDRKYDPKEQRDSYRMHYLMIRPMFFVNGWPVLSPEPYVGEPMTATGVGGLSAAAWTDEKSFGRAWPGMPAGRAASVADAVQESLENVISGWELIRFEENGNRIRLSADIGFQKARKLVKNGVFHRCWDFENSRPVTVVSGIDQNGNAYWGKAY